MNRKLLIKVLMLFVFVLGIGSRSFAQFRVEEGFNGKVSKKGNVIFKGDAYLTANNNANNNGKFLDKDGEGWLRLTEDIGGRNGGVIIDEAFASNMGVVLDFEYKTWRTIEGNDDVKDLPIGTPFRGGDGFTVFLIDGKTPGANVKLGGTGHNLGYGGSEQRYSVTGAYLGLGLDEYGNYIYNGTFGYSSYFKSNEYWHAQDGMSKSLMEKFDAIGIPKGEPARYFFKNSIGLRGKSSPKNQSNTPLIGFSTLTQNGYEVGYPSVLTERPSDVVFYRRVQMELYKYGNGYRVEVRWMREKNGTFEHLFTSEYTEAPFETLKIGFAASTGSAVNYHEIRGLSVFVPEGVKVEKKADKESAILGDDLEYTVEVRNLSQSVYKGIILNDLLDDLKPYFEVSSITYKSELGLTETKATNFNTGLKNLKDIKIDLGARDAAVFTIKGKVNKVPTIGKITNTATINVDALKFTTVEAKDPSRLTSSVETKITDGSDPVGPDFCDNAGDQFISGYHSTIIKTKHGFEIFGKNALATGNENAYSPVKIIPANGYTFTGSPMFATMGANTSKNVQYFLLTTGGLYVWGNNNVVIDGGVSGSAFRQISLPSNVKSTDVKYMTASHGVLVLLTNDGELHTLGNRFELYGDNSNKVDSNWHKVSFATGKALSKVKEVKVHTVGGFALLEDNTLIAWGKTVFNGSQTVTSSDFAIVVDSPLHTNEKAKMIAITGDDKEINNKKNNAISYYVLSDSGNVYSIGNNGNGQLGIGNSNNQLTWQQVKISKDVNLENIIFITGSDNSSYSAAAGAIDKYGKLYLWGNNDKSMLGQSGNGNIQYATVPHGFLDEKTGKLKSKAIYVEVGGHTSMYMGDNMKFCYIGHRIDGSMGDGTNDPKGDVVEKFDCDNTPVIDEMCAKLTIELEPGLSIIKDGEYIGKGTDKAIKAGGIIRYTITVSNSGNTLLTNIEVTDPKLPNFKATIPSLIAEDSKVYEVDYIVTQEDIERGGVFNQADGKGNSPTSPVTGKSKPTTPVSIDNPDYPLEDPAYKNCIDCTVTILEQQPSITLVKVGVVDEDADTAAGNGVINYTFTITNTGNVSLTVKDFKDSIIDPFKPKFGVGEGTGSLEVGKTWTATATYTITDADVDAEKVVNQATVKGTAPKGKEVEAKSGTKVGNNTPTITPVEGGGPLMTNPHIYHKVQ